jgi:hypothetical protein
MSGAETPFSNFSSAKTHLLLRFYPALSLFCSKTDNLQLQDLVPTEPYKPCVMHHQRSPSNMHAEVLEVQIIASKDEDGD